MGGIGWQFSRRTPPELKTGYIAGWFFSGLFLVNSLEFHSLYFSREISVAGKYPKFLSDICLASPEFSPFGRSRGLILSARLVPSLVLRWDIIASGVAK